MSRAALLYTIGGQPVTATTVLDASATPYTIVATFTPTNATKFVSGGTTQQTLTVNQATPTLSWAPIGPITYGTNLTGLLDASSGGVAGSLPMPIASRGR